MKTPVKNTTAGRPQKLFSFRLVSGVLFFIVLIPLLPIFITRRLNWWEAWIYAALYIITFFVSRILAARRDPGIIAERARFMQHDNTQRFDQILVPLIGIGGVLVVLIAGLDELLQWSPAFNITVKMISLCVMIAGYVLSSYALITNTFFSGTVRLQTERGHHLISSGPYRWMRHPGYAGAFLSYLATPFFLDSIWVMIPVLFVLAVLAIRTRLEDQFLQDNLEGYRDYTRQVRFRIVPGIW